MSDHSATGPGPVGPTAESDPLGIADDLLSYSARHSQPEEPAAQPAAPDAAAAGEWAEDDGVPTVPRQLLAEELASAEPPAEPPETAYQPSRSASEPVAAEPASAVAEPPRPRGGLSAIDFLDRRVESDAGGPATWGWRGRIRRLSGGAISPRVGPAERAHREARRLIQRDFDGPRTVVFVNPKGGAAKTTGVLAAGYTFGTVRGGGVIAWDNNETRGTLGIRGSRTSHRNTTRELLGSLGYFAEGQAARIGDLGAFVRSQGDAHFDVLASDERPDVTGTIRAEDFTALHRLLQRFYRIILIDTGNNMRAENWLAAAEAADLLVVTSTVREDTGYSGLWMLDALQDAGYADLRRKTITVLSDPSPSVDQALARDLASVYGARTRSVHRVPYDEALVAGSVVPYGTLSPATREGWLAACAAIAEAL